MSQATTGRADGSYARRGRFRFSSSLRAKAFSIFFTVVAFGFSLPGHNSHMHAHTRMTLALKILHFFTFSLFRNKIRAPPASFEIRIILDRLLFRVLISGFSQFAAVDEPRLVCAASRTDANEIT